MSEGDLAVLAQAVNMTKLNPEIISKKQYPRKVTEEEWKKSNDFDLVLKESIKFIKSKDSKVAE